jgi:hypothetical protein
MGKRLTVGKAFVMDTALGNDIHQRILILWSFRDSEFPLVRLYDPDPENDRETNDALAVANSLKSGKPVPANGFTRFLSTVSRTVNLYSAHPAENALWFKGSETIKTNQTQRSIEYFIRQNDDMYTIIFMTRRDDGTTRYAIAELPGPALSIPPRQLK